MRKAAALLLLVGVTALGSNMAEARVDVGIGIPAPVVVAPPPVYYEPAPVVVQPVSPVVAVPAYYYDNWRARAWREREWREQQWREREWRERRQEGGNWNDDDD